MMRIEKIGLALGETDRHKQQQHGAIYRIWTGANVLPKPILLDTARSETNQSNMAVPIIS